MRTPMLAWQRTSAPLSITGAVEGSENAIGEFVGHRLVVDQHDELVTAEAADGVAGTYAVAQALGDDDQQAVALGVPESVVDRLEVVEVNEQSCWSAAGSRGTVERAGQALAHAGAVREVGERVEERPVRQL